MHGAMLGWNVKLICVCVCVWPYEWKDTCEVIYLKSGGFSIIFRRTAAILNQMNRDHVHHLTPLRSIVLLFFYLRLIHHKFSPISPLTHTFYLPRPFNNLLFHDYKNITDWRTGGFEPPVEERFSASVQTGPKAHPILCTTDIVSISIRQCGRVVILTTHPI